MPINASTLAQDLAARRKLVALEEQITTAGTRASKQAAARDNRPGLGPIVLGLFMLCILIHCMIYLYNQTRDFWAQAHLTPFKSALVHDYRNEPATAAAITAKVQAAPLASLPEDTWHLVAPGSDADELRLALRLDSLSRSPHMETWSNPITGHRGSVMPVSLRSDEAGCRPYRIKRQDNSLSDTVDFCPDGSIRQGIR